MNLLSTGITSAILLVSISGNHNSGLPLDRPIQEYCAMATLGYKVVAQETGEIEDLYSLPEPFNALPITNYKLAHQAKFPKACRAYLASN